MAKQLNVSLAFQADTSQAKRQLQDLQNSLNKLMNSTVNKTEGLGLTKDLMNAINAAGQLKTMLQQATTSAGTLDLSAFNSSLQKSGMKLSEYGAKLNELGPDGAKAFSQITKSILSAEMPLRRTNGLLAEFAVTLKNTARWQISSSILHGFMGAIQSAYGYAQDLNKSLNNIRIVTGYSVDEMANFAVEANKAAKALSTTTTSYTDAALIYYQQGIRDQSEIAERTETTIKLANVSRQSAEEVSQQMTAIWNNFDDGTKSLEYYADAITALGANTASSSEEIATGLEKFAAVSKTVGLSYEYATAALATITAQTRQSADTVGTGLRTLFARLESLKLGETLEDDVDLNKYSKALHDVGVEVLDASGEMRQMDNILDDLAARWDQLTQAQQMALAQTVGGVRQYTNLIALMSNWDKMQQNIATAKGSNGTLQEQADIYAESWEASQKRVKAAAQEIYNTLIDEDFFIGINNFFEKFLGIISNTIKGLGGLPGLLTTIGALLTSTFGNQIAQSIQNVFYNLTYNSESVKQSLEQLRNEAIQTLKELGGDSISGSAIADVYGKQAAAQDQLLQKTSELAQKGKEIAEEDEKRIQLSLDLANNLGEQVIKTAELREQQEDITQEIINQIKQESMGKITGLNERLSRIKSLQISYVTLSQFAKNADKAMNDAAKSNNDETKQATITSLVESFKKLKDELDNVNVNMSELDPETKEVLKSFQSLDPQNLSFDELQEKIKGVKDILDSIGADSQKALNSLKEALIKDAGVPAEEATKMINELKTSLSTTGSLSAQQIEKFRNLGIVIDEAGNIIQNAKLKTYGFADGITAAASTLMSLASAIQSIKGLGNIWSDKDMSTGEKILSTMTTMGMVVPRLVTAFNAENIAKLAGLHIDRQATVIKIAKNNAQLIENLQTKGGIVGKLASALATKGEAAAEGSLSVALIKRIALQMLSNWYYAAAVAVIGLLVAAIVALTKAQNADAIAAEKAAEAAQHLGEEAERVKTKAQELHDAFNNYESIVEKLEQCTRGTKEWREALDEVNTEVLNIMQNHPELIGQMDIVREDGRLVLKNYQEILDIMDQAAGRLQAAAIGANAHASEAKLTLDKTNVYRKFAKQEYNSETGYIDETAVKANKAIDSIIKNIDRYSDALKLGKDNFKESLGDMYSTLNMSDTQFEQFYNSLTQLSNSSYAVAVQLDEAAKVAAQIVLGDKYTGLGDNVNNAIVTVSGEEYQDLYNTAYATVRDELSQKLRQGGDENKEEAAKLWTEYLKAIGENEATTKYKRTDNFIQGNKKNRTYHFKDAKGEEQSLTEAEIVDIIAASQAMGQLGDKAEELANNFSVMSEKGREFSAAIINSKDAFDQYYAANAMQNMTSKQIAELADTDDYEGRRNIWEMLDMSAEQYDAFAKTLGMSTLELTLFLQKGAQDVLTDFTHMGEELSKTPKALFDKTRSKFTELTIAEQKEIVEGYRKVFSVGGKEAVTAFDNMINQFGSQGAEVAQILSQIDFTDWNIDKQIKDAFKEADIELPDNIDEFINTMRVASNATKDLNLTDFRKHFGDIQKIVESLDEWGKTISAEDYETLGKGYEDYFTLMADGTYKLTGDAKKFYELVQTNQSQELLDKIAATQVNANNRQSSLDTINSIRNNSSYDITKNMYGGWAIDEASGESYETYNYKGFQAQLQYLEALGYDKGQLEKWNEADYKSEKMFEDVAKAIRETSGAYEALVSQTEQDTQSQKENVQAYYSLSTSLEDLEARKKDLIDIGIDAAQYDKDYKNQIQILGVEALQTATSLKEVAKIQDDYELTADQIKGRVLELATSFNLLKEAYMAGYISIDDYNKKVKEWVDTATQSATTLEELRVAVGQFMGDDNFIDSNPLYSDEYAQGLINLASKYDSCAEAVAEYQDALTTLASSTAENREEIEKMVEAAEEHLEMSIRAEEAASKHGLVLDTLKAQMNEIAKAEGVTEKTALEMAIANERMNRGVAELVNNWEDWKKILKESDKTAEDYAATLDDLSAAVTELVGWYDDLALDSEFVEENMGLIDKAAEGDVTSILKLGAAVAQLSIASADLDATLFSGALADGSVNAFQLWAEGAENAEAAFAQLQGSLESTFANLQAHMDELRENPDLLESLVGEGGLEEFVAELNAYAAATGMTATQMQEMLASVGVTANVQSDYQEKKIKVPAYREEVTDVHYKPMPGLYFDQEGQPHEYVATIPEYTKASVPVEPLERTGFVEVASISMDKNGETPKVQPPKFTGKRAPSAVAMSGGTGNKTGSKGKSSSSTPKKETKEKKNPTEEKERYHLINQQIERQSNILDRLGKSKDRAFGPQKQKWYTQELKSLKDMGKMYEEHLRQSKAYLASDAAVMKAWGAQISGKDNSILNYDDLVAKQVAAYNAAVDRYNASAQTDADKAAFKKAEEAYKKFQEDLKQYEDTVKQHEEDINNYIDNMIEQYDTMQAKTADAIEFRIEYDDSVLDFLDKLIDRLDSWNGSMFAAVDIMGKLNEKTGALIDKNKDLETATAETLEHFLMDYKEFDDRGNIIYQTGMSKSASDAFIGRFNEGALTDEDIAMLAHMPEEERQLLMDYAQQRQDNTDALIETAQAVVDDVERQFNDAKDELAEAAKPIASAAAAMDNYAAIIDIVGADYLGVTDDIMQRFRDQQWNVLHETTMANKATMESLAAQRDMINEEMNKALEDGNMELVEMYREKLKGINDEVQSATEAWYQSWQAELSKLTEDFEKHIDEIKNKALDLAAGDAGTWQSLKDSMDYAQQVAERFLPEYKEIYEFSKLNRDINKSIDDTDNIKNKQALKKLQDEINKLQEKSGQISQYDLDNARRRYELELARLALEESRNAKEVVRLSKDSEGNWSYIYTASEEDVADAEQNYEDKLFAMQQANADYINDLQGQLVQATEDYYNKVAEINLIYKDDDEKRREELEKARMQYEETMQYYGGELQKAMDNNKQLYDEDWAWYSDYTQKINDDQGYRLGELDNYVTEFDDTMLGMATGYDSVKAFEDDLLDHSIDTLGQMDEAYEHWSEQIHFSMEEAGTSVEYFAEDMMSQVDDVIVPKAEEARDTVEYLGEAVIDIMADMVDAADQWRVSYSTAMDAIIAKNNAVIQSIRQVMSALSALKTAEIGHDTTTGTAPEGSKVSTKTTPTTQSQGSGGGGSGSGSGGGGSTTQPQKQTDPDAGLSPSQLCDKYGHQWGDWKLKEVINGYAHFERECERCHKKGTKEEWTRNGGCFAAGTKILLPNRQLKNIEEVQLGEEIVAYNIETNTFENKTVNMIYFKQGYNQMATLELSNGKILTMTLGHPLLTKEGWKSLDLENSAIEHGVPNASLLSVGDVLIGYEGSVSINNIKIYNVNADYIVYCLGVDGYHNFIAEDIVVHNGIYAQNSKVQLASGGYTGDFGNSNEGKLAVLHSKELVLNQDDTKNILSAVDMVRSISKTIDAYAMTNQFTIGNLTAARGVNPINGQMEQSVTITAEFPNATDRNEIAEAFNTLINQASQYANRKY